MLVLFTIRYCSCSRKAEAETVIDQALTLSLTSSWIYSDNLDELHMIIKDASGNDVTSQSTFYINDRPISGNSYKTLDPAAIP